MGSTFGGIHMVSRSLTVHQIAQNTVGHNISNADTVGYSRQMVNFLAMTPTGEEYGRYGRNKVGDGVIVGSVVRARDVFTDKQYWKESANLGYLQSANYILNKVELIFREPSETGIQSVLNKFWSSWQNLSTNASNSGTRATVAQDGVSLAKAITDAANALIGRVDEINDPIKTDVSTINRITESIDKLNKQIAYIEAGGHDHANDLRDARDLLVDDLSKLVNVTVKEETNGKYTITASITGGSGSFTLVDGINGGSQKLGTTTGDPTDTVFYDQNYYDSDFGYERVYVTDASGNKLEFTNGEIKALIDYRDKATSGIYNSLLNLSKISKFLLQDFNEVHRAGYGTDNINGRNFFGEDGINYKDDDDLLAADIESEIDWIEALKVNSAIADSLGRFSAEGLSIIAAKTAPNMATLSSVALNLGEGYPIVTTTGAYTGTGPTNILLKVTSTDATGNVTGLQYSTDDGANWSNTVTISGDTGSFTVNGATITLDTSEMTGTEVNNKYSFVLELGHVIGTVSPGSQGGTAVPIITASGGYTGVNPPTNVRLEVTSLDQGGNVDGLKYSEDGGSTWYEVVGNSSDPLLFVVQGVEVKLDVSNLQNAGVGDSYSFNIGKGSSVGVVTDAASNGSNWFPTVQSATGTYSGGALPTDVLLRATSSNASNVDGLEFSIDGGTTWDNITIDYFRTKGYFTVADVEITLDVSGISGAAINDIYNLAVSNGNNAKGDNAILLGNRLKTDTSATLGKVSLDSFYAAMIGTLGVQSQDSQRLETNQQSIIDQLYNMRQDTCGVNVDEELVDMIRFQKGYTSAARVLTAMDEMLEKLINGTGVVGR